MISGYIINPVRRGKKTGNPKRRKPKGKSMPRARRRKPATRRKNPTRRRATARRRTTARRNPVRRKAARRNPGHYASKRRAPMRRRRRNPTGKKALEGVFISALAVAAGAGVAAFANQKLTEHLASKADEGLAGMLKDSGGWGRAGMNILTGLVVAGAGSQLKKQGPKKAAMDFGLAWVAYGVAAGVHGMMHKASQQNGNGPEMEPAPGLGRLIEAPSRARGSRLMDVNALAGLYAGSVSNTFSQVG